MKAIAYIGDDVEDVIVSTGFAVINPNKEIEPKFLYYLLRSEKFIDRICALSVGVSYPAINSSELSSLSLSSDLISSRISEPILGTRIFIEI